MWPRRRDYYTRSHYELQHHHKNQGLGPLIHSVSRITAARANASSVFQLFSFLVVCSGMISKGFGFVAFFAGVEASSVCIHPPCLDYELQYQAKTAVVVSSLPKLLKLTWWQRNLRSRKLRRG